MKTVKPAYTKNEKVNLKDTIQAKTLISKLKKIDKDVLAIRKEPGEDLQAAIVRAHLHPVTNAAWTATKFQQSLADSGMVPLVAELSKHVEAVKIGNMNRPETMLLAQAHTLDVIFNSLAQRAGVNIESNRDAAEKYLRMALKAQAQCRTTLETLAEIKAPKSATFIKQTNIAEQQQVNNGDVRNGNTNPAHEKKLNPSNEL
ncbi:MAG: hypothetical protein DID92_2727744208 [Candidatus Nitrotoga sp. SPKER]|nr:MAG: hypothetical protein DID92_2727744208 [Candidatus Nitrotoga sp. SPKER]